MAEYDNAASAHGMDLALKGDDAASVRSALAYLQFELTEQLLRELCPALADGECHFNLHTSAEPEPPASCHHNRNRQILVMGQPQSVFQATHRNRFAYIDLVMVKRARVQRKMPAPKCVREGWRLVRVGREDSKKLCVSKVPQQILKRRLDIHTSGYWKLASCRCDVPAWHPKMSEQDLA